MGLLGPALGGGHSRYEGLYGMIMDSIVHYNIVLADGREIGVNETSHADLLWALKGAGHNFAIVTSVVKKIYPGEDWHFHTYTWTQDKLETVFEALNTFAKSYNGTTPPKMGVNYGAIIMNQSISTTEVGSFLTPTSSRLLIIRRRCWSGAFITPARVTKQRSS